MNFQESLRNEMTVSYRNMLSGQTPIPFNTVVKMGQYEAFERSFENYHKRLESERRNFNNSLSQIIRRRDDRVRAKNDADRRRRENAAHRRFLCVEWIKTIAFNIPTIALFIVSIILLRSPELILEHISFGWILGIYIPAFVLSMVVGGVVAGKSDHYSDSYEFVKQRCAIMIAGAFAFIVLMSLGLGLAPQHLLYGV